MEIATDFKPCPLTLISQSNIAGSLQQEGGASWVSEAPNEIG